MYNLLNHSALWLGVYTGLPTKDETLEATVQNLCCFLLLMNDGLPTTKACFFLCTIIEWAVKIAYLLGSIDEIVYRRLYICRRQTFRIISTLEKSTLCRHLSQCEKSILCRCSFCLNVNSLSTRSHPISGSVVDFDIKLPV